MLGDALYDCAAVVELCRQYNWSYILTSKGGRQPSEMAAVDRTLERAPKTFSRQPGREKGKMIPNRTAAGTATAAIWNLCARKPPLASPPVPCYPVPIRAENPRKEVIIGR